MRKINVTGKSTHLPQLQHRRTSLTWTPQSTCPRNGGPPVHPGGPRWSASSRMSGLPPEQVDPQLGYGSPARDPDGWSAGPVTSLGRARAMARG